METEVTERKFEQLDELHAQQYRLENSNATVCLVKSSLATVRRFPAEAAELTKAYQSNATVLEYTRRILRDATHQLGQQLGDQRPLDQRSVVNSPVRPVEPPAAAAGDRVSPERRPPRAEPPVVHLETIIQGDPHNYRRPEGQNGAAGRMDGSHPSRGMNNPHMSHQGRSQSQRRPDEAPERGNGQLPRRSRESPDKFDNPRSSGGALSGGRVGTHNDGEYLGSVAFFQSLPEGWDILPNLDVPVDFSQYSMMQRSGLMPTFNGTVEAYPSFKAHFKLAVHQVALPIFAKFMALKGALEKASELIPFLNTLEPGTTGYALLLNELEDRFGGRERQLHRHASNIRFLPVCSEDQHRNLQMFVDTIQAYHACLGMRAEVEIESYNHFNTIYYKLDRNLRMKYRTYCRTMNYSAASEGSAATLLAWVRNVVLAPLRMETARIRPEERPRHNNQARPDQRRQLPRGPLPRALAAEGGAVECVLCTGQNKAHNLDKCPIFKEKSVHDRKAVTFQLRRCFICLNSGHRASQCRANKCHCGQRHHQLLCTRERQALHVQERPPWARRPSP